MVNKGYQNNLIPRNGALIKCAQNLAQYTSIATAHMKLKDSAQIKSEKYGDHKKSFRNNINSIHSFTIDN